MTEACERWMAISDREALDEPVSDAEREFRQEHEATCKACGGEASLYRDLAGESAESVPLPHERVDRVLGELGGERRAENPPSRNEPAPNAAVRRPFWTKLGPRTRRALAGLAAAAALASLLSFFDPTQPAKHAAPAPAELARVVLTLVSGASTGPALGELSRGSVVTAAAGPACLFVEPGVSACIDERSELRVAETALADRRLELVRGRVVVSLQKQPHGTSLSVVTANGRVTATGTVFSVEIVGATTVVRVEEGTVVASRPGAATRAVHHNERVVLGEDAVSTLPSGEAERDRALVLKGSLFGGGEAALLDVPRTATSAWVKLDGVLLGAAPLSVMVAPGPHRFESGDAERVLSSGPIVVTPGRSVIGKHAAAVGNTPPAPILQPAPVKGGPSIAPVRSDTVEEPRALVVPTPDARASSAAFPEQPPETRSAPELLRTARSLRAQGRLREAADAYLLLQSVYPASAEALASHVSLGDVDLAVGDATGALAAFDAYLRSGGPLTQEARYGRIQALTALGRASEAEAATEEFLRLYPNSVQARSLRTPR